MTFNYEWRTVETLGPVLTVFSAHHINSVAWFSAHHILDIRTKQEELDSSYCLCWIVDGIQYNHNTRIIFICPKSEITRQKIHLGRCGGFTLAGWQVPTKATLVTPLLSRTGERKHRKHSESLMAWEKNRERSVITSCHGQNQVLTETLL